MPEKHRNDDSFYSGIAVILFFIGFCVIIVTAILTQTPEPKRAAQLLWFFGVIDFIGLILAIVAYMSVGDE